MRLAWFIYAWGMRCAHSALICVLFSAILYLCPFIAPEYAWWTVFLFPVPIYWSSLCKPVYFGHGFMWGIAVFGVSAYPIIMDSVGKAGEISVQAGLWVALLWVLGICYFACYSGFWFWLTEKIVAYGSVVHVHIGMWVCTTVLYVTWIDRYSFWPFLRIEGHPLMHPLVALAAQAQMLRWLPVVGKMGMTLLMLLPAALGVLCVGGLCRSWMVRGKLRLRPWALPVFTGINSALAHARHSCATARRRLTINSRLFPFLFFLLSVVPWCGLYFVRSEQKAPPDWLDFVAWVPLHGTGTMVMAHIAQGRFKNIIQENTHIKLIVLPESAFYTDGLCSDTACTRLWHEEYLKKAVSIVCGSFRSEQSGEGSENNQDAGTGVSAGAVIATDIGSGVGIGAKKLFFNSCYLVSNGCVKQQFCKKHTVPFMEQVPAWARGVAATESVFCSEMPAITPSQNRREPFLIDGVGAFVPYICSELFFADCPDDSYPQFPILVLVNDLWTRDSFLQHHLLQVAQVKAVQWQREMLYVSYTYAVYINTQGISYFL